MKSLRKVAIGGGAVLALLLILLVALPFVIDVNRFKGPILKKVESQINGKVTLDRIGLKIFPFIGLRLEGLSVTNLPETPFAETPLLKLGEMDLRVHLKSLLERKIVASLLLRAPEIQFIKLKEGSNVDALIKPEAEPKPVAEKPFDKAQGKPGLFTDIVVEKVTIRDGLLVYDDRSALAAPAAPGGKPMRISGLRLDVTNAVLTDTSRPIGIDLGMRLFDAPVENVSLKAEVAADQKAKSAKITKAELKLAGSPIQFEASVEDYEKRRQVDAKLSAPALAMASIYSLLPQAKQSLPAGSSLEGSLSLNVSAQGTPEAMNVGVALDLKPAAIRYGDQFVKTAGTPMNFDLTARYTPANPDVSGSLSIESFRSTKFTLTNLKSAFAYDKKVARLTDLGFDLFDGHFSGSGTFDMTAEKPAWDFNLKADKADINAALTQVGSLPDVMTGRGSIDLTIKGTGNTAEDVKKSIFGNLNVTLQDGDLKAFNIAPGIFTEELVGGMTQSAAKVPTANLAGLSFSPPGAVRDLKGTPFDRLASQITIQDGKIHFPELDLSHAGTTVLLGGTVDLDQKLDLSGKYYLAKGLTESWITNAKLRSFLTGKDGRFLLPFKITGQVMKPAIAPDVGYVSELMGKALVSFAKEEAKQQVTKQVEKIVPKAEEAAKEEIKKAVPDLGRQLKKLF